MVIVAGRDPVGIDVTICNVGGLARYRTTGMEWISMEVPYLSPEECSHSESETPQPLLDSERSSGEPTTTELNDQDLWNYVIILWNINVTRFKTNIYKINMYLRDEGADPDGIVDGVREESLE